MSSSSTFPLFQGWSLRGSRQSGHLFCLKSWTMWTFVGYGSLIPNSFKFLCALLYYLEQKGFDAFWKQSVLFHYREFLCWVRSRGLDLQLICQTGFQTWIVSYVVLDIVSSWCNIYTEYVLSRSHSVCFVSQNDISLFGRTTASSFTLHLSDRFLNLDLSKYFHSFGRYFILFCRIWGANIKDCIHRDGVGAFLRSVLC